VRPTNEKLGLITFDSTATSSMSPTTSTSQIATSLAGTPVTGPGSNPPAAIALALKQLAATKVALGAIVVISDGQGIKLGAGGPTPQAVKAAAAAANRPLITLGLKDAASTPASLRAVAQAAPGTYETVTPARLTAAMLSIQQELSSNAVVRYKSRAPYAKPVAVSASADGIAGSVHLGYRSPAPPRAPAQVKKAAPHRSGSGLAYSTLLSPTPSFASANPVATAPVSNSFWSSSSWIPVIAAICAVLLVAAIALALHCPSKNAVRTRVGPFIPLAEQAADGSGEGTRKTGVLSSLQRGSWWPPFVEAVEISGSPHTPVYLVKRAAAIGLVAALLVTVVSGSVLFGLLPLIGWPYLLKVGVKRGAEKQRMKFGDTLPAYLQDMASAIRVGRSFAGAVAVVAESADEPTRSQLERAATDEALGLPLEQTLQAVSDRMHNSDMDQVALIAGVHRKTGSNISEALDRVAESARERADLRREMRALTSQAKMSSSVLTGLPVVLLLGLSVLSPTYAHPLLHTTLGLIALAFGGLMIFGGWKVMGKITRIKV
jgi:Flp pilus assembly protein TadB